MGKLGGLLVALAPKGASDDPERDDPEADEPEEGEGGEQSKSLDSAEELANLLIHGKGYCEDGTCVHAPMHDEAMKDPRHPIQAGLRAFKRAHDSQMTAMRNQSRDSARRAEDRGTPGGESTASY